jgi:hypothetical protein
MPAAARSHKEKGSTVQELCTRAHATAHDGAICSRGHGRTALAKMLGDDGEPRRSEVRAIEGAGTRTRASDGVQRNVEARRDRLCGSGYVP